MVKDFCSCNLRKFPLFSQWMTIIIYPETSVKNELRPGYTIGYYAVKIRKPLYRWYKGVNDIPPFLMIKPSPRKKEKWHQWIKF